MGILYMQVCAVEDATDEEILEICNLENLCGTTNGWVTVCRNEETETSPVKCESYKGRIHFIVNC